MHRLIELERKRRDRGEAGQHDRRADDANQRNNIDASGEQRAGQRRDDGQRCKNPLHAEDRPAQDAVAPAPFGADGDRDLLQTEGRDGVHRLHERLRLGQFSESGSSEVQRGHRDRGAREELRGRVAGEHACGISGNPAERRSRGARHVRGRGCREYVALNVRRNG